MVGWPKLCCKNRVSLSRGPHFVSLLRVFKIFLQTKYCRYPVGTSYKTEDCSECLCKIGGVSHCAPKVCDPCEKGLRSTVTTTCQCTCQPCPDGTTLCPTSDVCFNSTLWCNGIQDCPDDETGCVTTTPKTTTTTPTPVTAES